MSHSTIQSSQLLSGRPLTSSAPKALSTAPLGITSAAVLGSQRHSHTSLNLHQKFPAGISGQKDAAGGRALGRCGGASIPSVPLKRRAAAATAADCLPKSQRPKTCKIEEDVEKLRPEAEEEDGGEGDVGGSALFDYGDLFPQELSDSAAGKTNFAARAKDQDSERLKRELRVKKERLIRITSVSLMGRPDLENPTDPTRIAVLEAAMSVAERDAEFVLKVRPTSTLICCKGMCRDSRPSP